MWDVACPLISSRTAVAPWFQMSRRRDISRVVHGKKYAEAAGITGLDAPNASQLRANGGASKSHVDEIWIRAASAPSCGAVFGLGARQQPVGYQRPLAGH